MSPATWQYVQEIFDAALELDRCEREAFLRRLETARPQLHALVISLLAAHAAIERLARMAAPTDSIRH